MDGTIGEDIPTGRWGDCADPELDLQISGFTGLRLQPSHRQPGQPPASREGPEAQNTAKILPVVLYLVVDVDLQPAPGNFTHTVNFYGYVQYVYNAHACIITQ